MTWFGKLWDRLVFGGKGHRSIGRVTMYRFDCAMAGAVSVWTRRWGYVCFGWPGLGRTWSPVGMGPYLYLSPNGTPWAATLLLGGRFTRDERLMARVRRVMLGHGYDAARYDLRAVGVVEDGLRQIERLEAINAEHRPTA